MTPTETPLTTLIKEMREDAKSDMSFVVGSGDILRVLGALHDLAMFAEEIMQFCDYPGDRESARAVLAKHFPEESK